MKTKRIEPSHEIGGTPAQLGPGADAKVQPLLSLPVRTAVADAVKGNRFPAGDDTFRLAVAAEAFRVLRPAGVFRIWSASGGGRLWLPPLVSAGFSPVTLGAGYAEGVRP